MRFRRSYPHFVAPIMFDRNVVHVQDENGHPIAGARVTISGAQRLYFETWTPADGHVLFFQNSDGAYRETDLNVRAAYPGAEMARVDRGERSWTVTLSNVRAEPVRSLDLAFVIDTTGSMRDELEYLKREIRTIAAAVKEGSDLESVRFGLVVFRDRGDAYVTRRFDFSDLERFQKALATQRAEGGGDDPEATDAAVEAMNGLSWRTGKVARVAFLVTDAPPHEADLLRYFGQVQDARHAGVRLYTVGASGTDEKAEFVLRETAALTGARYLFLTDDSGIGDAHSEPRLPCYQVQQLNTLIVRMIRGELAGKRVEPRPEEIVRTVGLPRGGTCSTRDDAVAARPVP